MMNEKNLIQVQKGQKGFSGTALFSDVNFSINESEHVGVIGPNGAGKTTLFKILIEEESLDEGLLIRSRDLNLGYLSQHDHWSATETGNEYLARLSETPLWETKSKGRSLKVPEPYFDKPILSLSGGYRMRMKLMGLLSQNPNLMLLDEPTNYLDLETTLRLENFLQSYEGAFLLISHDREFLRRTTDHILEVESGDITKFNGNIDDYFEQKVMLRGQLEARARSLEEKRESVLEFVARFGAKASKAKQAQSRLRSLDRLEMINLKELPLTAQIRIPTPSWVGKTVLQLKKCDFGYSQNKVLFDVNVEIRRGDHVAVVGLNGVGKSTLLKGLAGTLSPFSGQREVGYQVEIGLYNQHVIEVLDPEKTVLESLEASAHHEVSQQEVKDLAGSLLFSGESIRKKVKVLSGGEKSRVALGQILLKKVPLLLLDEPTNHLDFQTVEALTKALSTYEGTLIVVSHDRGFIKRIATKILEVSSGNVRQYPGTYDDYVWSLQRNLLSEASEGEVIAAKDVKSPSADKFTATSYEKKKERDRRLRQLDKEIRNIENRLSLLQARNQEINQQLIEGKSLTPDDYQQLAENAKAIDQFETQWLALEEERQIIHEA